MLKKLKMFVYVCSITSCFHNISVSVFIPSGLRTQSSSTASPDVTRLQQETASLQVMLDRSNSDLAARESTLKTVTEQLNSFKSSAEEVAGKVTQYYFV